MLVEKGIITSAHSGQQSGGFFQAGDRRGLLEEHPAVEHDQQRQAQGDLADGDGQITRRQHDQQEGQLPVGGRLPDGAGLRFAVGGSICFLWGFRGNGPAGEVIGSPAGRPRIFPGRWRTG